MSEPSSSPDTDSGAHAQDVSTDEPLVLDVATGSRTLPEQAAAEAAQQAAALPDTGERAQAVEALSREWGSEFTSAWLEDPTSERTQKAVYAVLQKHWGEGYMENLNLAKQVLSDYAPPELRRALDQSGLGNDPSVIMFASAIGVALQQAKQQVGDAQTDRRTNQPGAPVAPSLDAQIAAAMEDTAYFDDRSARHKSQVAKVNQLFALRYPN